MHPLGECTCGGEGTCLWCQRAEEWERLTERVDKAEADLAENKSALALSIEARQVCIDGENAARAELATARAKALEEAAITPSTEKRYKGKGNWSYVDGYHDGVMDHMDTCRALVASPTPPPASEETELVCSECGYPPPKGGDMCADGRCEGLYIRRERSKGNG
jgi:hypothetical protein